MRTIIKILLVALILLFSSGYAICRDIPFAVLDAIFWDTYKLFGAEPETSEAIISKYKDEKYYPIFNQILENRKKYKEDIVIDVIMLSAILQDKRHLESIKRIHSEDYQYVDVIRFYYFKIGYNKKENLNYMKEQLDILVVKPSDSYLIAALPFLDDVNLAITYLDKITPKSDGAVSELIVWVISYLYFINKDNPQVIEKIKQSYTYKVFKDIIHEQYKLN